MAYALTICVEVRAGLAGLAAAIQEPASVPGVMLTNISLRMLHADKQSRFQRPLVAWLQRTLRETTIGQARAAKSQNFEYTIYMLFELNDCDPDLSDTQIMIGSQGCFQWSP